MEATTPVLLPRQRVFRRYSAPGHVLTEAEAHGRAWAEPTADGAP